MSVNKVSRIPLNLPDGPGSDLRPVWIHSLAPGVWPGANGTVSISAEDIQRIADTYNPALHEAPTVIGHPSTDDPAYGWVRAAKAKADGLWLHADLLPEFAEMVRRKLYKKVSVSLYPPQHPANPVPGGYSLKHLGFLGAQPPAVKGLEALALQETENAITLEFSEKESLMDEEELAQKQEAVELAEANLAEKQKEIELAEADLATRKKALRTQELTAKLDVHVAAGRVLPAQKQLMLSLYEQCDGQTIELAEGQSEQLLDAFDKFLGALPAQVELNEVATPEEIPVTNFAAPEGYSVSAEGLALDAKVQAWLKQNPGKLYTEALAAVV